MKFLKLSKTPYLEDANDLGGNAPLDNPIDAPPPQDPPPTDPPSPPVEKIKIKYNHEDMEIPYEEAVTHIQKGMNYEKGIERAKQEARDAYIAEQGYEWNGKPITTEAEYKEALAEAERQKELKEKGLDPDEYKKFVEGDPAVKKAREWEQNKTAEERNKADVKEFLSLFKKEEGRAWDPDSDVLPDEVIALTQKGKTLSDAYAYHLNEKLKAKIAELEGKKKADETNQQNAETSTGSVTGNGNGENNFFTADQVRNMSKEQVKQNLKAIEESMKKW